MMKLAGVVVWYNPTEDDKKNIDSYLEDLDILYIMDNSEKKTSIEKNKKIKYVFNNENQGISKPLNEAAKMALKEGYCWLLTMDQDSKMNKDIFNEFANVLKATDTTNVGIISPWHDTKIKEEKPIERYTNPLEVMTSGNFVNLNILNKLGYFDEKLFIDGVDIEYGLRLNKNGYKIVQMNNVSMEHNLGNIEYHKFLGKEFMCTNHNYLRQYYMARNYRYIRDKYIGMYPEYCKKLVKIKGLLFKIFMYENDKCRKYKYIFKGIKDYKKNIYGKLVEV